MTPSARLQAAIEILDGVIAAARGQGPSADKLVGDWLRSRRFAGSKDRRAIRELVYGAIRACGEVPVSGRAAVLRLAEADPALRALFDGTPYGPAALVPGEPVASAGVAPGWLEVALEQSGVDAAARAALLARAPLDIRVNSLKITRDELAERLVREARLATPPQVLAAPDGLRLDAGAAVETWPEFAEGLIEVQDHGSQLACLSLAAKSGETVVDLCAGAGGKTLALAAAMANTGRLVACDTDRTRLSRLSPRAVRAGAMVEVRLLNPQREAETLADLAGAVDAVLIDAPCSGTGTWRRNPEARWRLTPAMVQRHGETQGRLLALAATLVRPGGRMTYVVCSLLDAEGADVVAAFLSANRDWIAHEPPLPGHTIAARGPGVRLFPLVDGTDGFFFATLERLC